MDRTFWQKQTTKPLFADLIWSRPQTKSTSGKLLIIGGNVHGFAAAGQAYGHAVKAGIGEVRILLPDVLQKTVSKIMPTAYFAPSSPSGGFSQLALGEALEHATWADATLIPGDLGRNSETLMMLEKFVKKNHGKLTLTKDAADFFINLIEPIANRAESLLVINIAQLQQLARSFKFQRAFKYDMDLMILVETLHEFSFNYGLSLVVKHLDHICVAVNGKVSSTKTQLPDDETWRVPVSTIVSVWWLQNPTKPYEAMTTSLFSN